MVERGLLKDLRNSVTQGECKFLLQAMPLLVSVDWVGVPARLSSTGSGGCRV